MSAARTIAEARAAGVRIEVSGDGLKLNSARKPADAVIASIKEHKAQIIEYLRHVAEGWDGEDWQAFYDERAAIREFEGSLYQPVAERLAWGETIEEWCRQNPIPSDPLRCAGCGKPLGETVLDLPDKTRVHFEAKRNNACVIDAGRLRKQRAVDALAAFKLVPPQDWSIE